MDKGFDPSDKPFQRYTSPLEPHLQDIIQDFNIRKRENVEIFERIEKKLRRCLTPCVINWVSM
jgi:hypothetical protein